MEQTAQSSNWIDAWLETQQGWLGRWQTVAVEQRVDALRVVMDTLHAHLNPADISPEAMSVVQSFQSLLQSCMTGAGELAKMSATEGEASHRVWQQLLEIFPVGPARQHQAAWQAYLQAQAEYQLCMQVLMQSYGQVFADSLQAVPEQVAVRAAQGAPISSVRELYELWIHCGEQAFAKVARDAQFIAVQAASSNALTRLKLTQQALMAQWLQSHDLPTRSELNSVHLRLRELTARVAQLEQQRSVPAESKPSSDKGTRASGGRTSNGRPKSKGRP